MKEDLAKVKSLARDLRYGTDFPRSPRDRIVYHWFDVYDIEEGRL